jgi:hypothetical protein
MEQSSGRTISEKKRFVIQETAWSPLGAWESFYVIVGSSAAALTGLQFVVITLVADARREMGTGGGAIDAFATPTVVHFCAALLISVSLSAPWPGPFGPAFVVGTCGLVGVLYTALVLWRTTRQTVYQMVVEDWTWHVVLPLLAYIAQVVAAAMLRAYTLTALFAIAGSALLLVYIGIHNAWDTTTWVTAQQLVKAKEPVNATGATPKPTATPREPS